MFFNRPLSLKTRLKLSPLLKYVTEQLVSSGNWRVGVGVGERREKRGVG